MTQAETLVSRRTFALCAPRPHCLAGVRYHYCSITIIRLSWKRQRSSATLDYKAHIIFTRDIDQEILSTWLLLLPTSPFIKVAAAAAAALLMIVADAWANAGAGYGFSNSGSGSGSGLFTAVFFVVVAGLRIRCRSRQRFTSTGKRATARELTRQLILINILGGT